MQYRLIIKDAAVADAIAAYTWYEEKQNGLGERFLDALSERYADLSTHPEYYSYIAEDRLQVLRDVKLSGFPYVVVYEIDKATVVVYAVHSTHQDAKNKVRKR